MRQKDAVDGPWRAIVGWLLLLSALGWGLLQPSVARADWIDMSQYRGQVVAWIYWNSRCEACPELMSWAERLQQHHQQDGLSVLAINTDPALSYGDLPQVPAYELDIIYDSDASLLDTYPVASIPSVLLFDRQGRLLSTYTQWNSRSRLAIEARLDQALDQ